MSPASVRRSSRVRRNALLVTSAIALVLSHNGSGMAEALPRPKAAAPAKSSQPSDWQQIVREFDRNSRDSRRALLAALP